MDLDELHTHQTVAKAMGLHTDAHPGAVPALVQGSKAGASKEHP